MDMRLIYSKHPHLSHAFESEANSSSTGNVRPQEVFKEAAPLETGEEVQIVRNTGVGTDDLEQLMLED
jgi:hypothetical protein